MANKDNECKNLEILDKYTESINPLADIIKTQKKLQEETYKINFKDLTISEIL